MQPRKYVTIERSAPHKQTQRASYDTGGHRQTYDSNFHNEYPRYSSNTNLMKSRNDFVQPKIKYSDLHKSPSEVNFKSREEHARGNLVRRRGDGMVSNLKSELQNLKMEVSKLMNKDSQNKLYASRMDLKNEQFDKDSSDGNMSLGAYGKDISDTISVTSQKIIDEPLRRLESKIGSANYDHSHYMQLQNDLLKTQLRNLKNKYNSTKQQWKQKCEALERKNQYLEISLRRSQQALTDCKKALQVQVQTIKFQLTRKLQQQYEEQQRKSERNMQPVRDQLDQNELVQQKLNKLYEQLSQKSKTISLMNIDLNQSKGIIEKKTFQLKKQIEKNNQLSKQFQFSKRQNSRNKTLLQTEMAKKIQLTKTVQNLRQKVNELTKQLNLQKSIVNGSQQLENKYSSQLQKLKQIQDSLTQQNYELQNQLRKQKQLNESHQTQIKHLKNTISDFTTQVEQVSKNLRQQRQLAIQTEQRYRKMLDQSKQNGQKQLEILQTQYDRYRQSVRESEYRQEIQQIQLKSKERYDIKEKQRQISRWKAEFKMLKIKFDEHFAVQTAKKEQIQSYYRNYKQYKSKNKILQMRNKVLQQSAADYIEKIQNIEAINLDQKVITLQKMNTLILENKQFARKIQYMEQQLNQLRTITENQINRANEEENLRRQIQERILNLDLQGNDQLLSVMEKMKKRMSDQDDKINKYIKQMKNKDNLIKQLKKQIRTVLQTQQNELQKFRNKQVSDSIQQIKNKTFSCLQEMKNQSKKQINIQIQTNKELIDENCKMKTQIMNLNKQLIQTKQKIKSITQIYNQKSLQVQQIKDKKELDAENYSKKLEQLEKIKNQTIKNLQNQIVIKNQEIHNQRAQIKKILTSKTGLEQQNFDQALKNQIEASKKLREQLNKKNQQVYRLRDAHAILKTQLDNFKSQFDIAKLKFISDRKNLQVQYDVESQTLKSQFSMQQKKVQSLEQKIKLVIDENKKKDNFIQTYIMGKKLPTNQRQIVATFLKQFELHINGKDLSAKLQSQSQQLQKMEKYNFSLMKQIAELKEKLLTYQAISVDNSDLREQHFEDIDAPQKSLMNSHRIERSRLD